MFDIYKYFEKLHEFYNNLALNDLPMTIEKVETLILLGMLDTDLHDKTEYAIELRNLKQVSNHG